MSHFRFSRADGVAVRSVSVCVAALALAIAGGNLASAQSTTTTTPRVTNGVPDNTPPLLYTPPQPIVEPVETLKDGRNSQGMIIGTSNALNDVPLTGDQYQVAFAAREAVKGRIADATKRKEDATAALKRLAEESAQVERIMQRNQIEQLRLTVLRDRLSQSVRAIAVRRFTSDIDSAESVYPDPNRTLAEASRISRVRTLSFAASDQAVNDSARVATYLEARAVRQQQLTDERSRIATDQSNEQHNLEQGTADLEQANSDLPLAEIELAKSRVNTTVAGSDMPFVALDAYWRAAHRVHQEQPACGLDWWGLSGIGRTESNHGRHSGGEPGFDGRVTRLIIGNALDGTGGFQNIRDSDGGKLDGDGTFDRAIGPMQFIPTTWKSFAKDMTGDGYADPQNIYDGAYSSATYLCRYGPGLSNTDALAKGYFGYNHSSAYVSEVMERSLRYRELPVPSALT